MGDLEEGHGESGPIGSAPARGVPDGAAAAVANAPPSCYPRHLAEDIAIPEAAPAR